MSDEDREFSYDYWIEKYKEVVAERDALRKQVEMARTELGVAPRLEYRNLWMILNRFDEVEKIGGENG